MSDKSNNKNIIFKSICHDSDKYKLYYYPSSKRFKCYSNCGSMSVYDLIMKIKQCNFKESFEFLREIIGNTDRPFVGFDIPNQNTSLDEIIIPQLEPIERQFLYNIYSNTPIKEWIEEGITEESQKKFNIRYDKIGNRAIIPHFDWNTGKCVGIRVRNFNSIEVQKGKKYMPLIYDNECFSYATGNNLYGLNISKENIKKYKKVIAFESEKATMIYESMYPGNNISVAICGSNFSKTQQKILLDLGVEEIVISLDKQYEDENGEEGVIWKNKILKMCEGLKGLCKVSYTWDSNNLLNYKDAAVDCGKNTFEKLIKDRIFVN